MRTIAAEEKVDQAALFGVTLAAFLTLFVSEGAWNTINTLVGATLLSVLLGYYRPVWPSTRLDAWTKASTLALVVGLCASLAGAQSFQDRVIRGDWTSRCWEEVRREAPAVADRVEGDTSSPPAVPRVTPAWQEELVENCLGNETSKQLWKIWLTTAVLTACAYMLGWRLRPGSKNRTTQPDRVPRSRLSVILIGVEPPATTGSCSVGSLVAALCLIVASGRAGRRPGPSPLATAALPRGVGRGPATGIGGLMLHRQHSHHSLALSVHGVPVAQ